MGSQDHQGAVEWYLCRDEKRYGPFSFSVLLQGIGENRVIKDDLIWRPGWDAWQPITLVPGLFASAESDTEETPSTRAVPQVTRSKPDPQEAAVVGQTQQPAPAPRKRNYFARHWRGELSLPVSYWVNGFLAGIAAAMLAAIFTVLVQGFKAAAGTAMALSLVGFVAAILGLATWQWVGVWRSATSYQASGKRFWGGLAKVAVVVAAIASVRNFSIFVPLISEHVQIALGDTKFGKSSFRLLRNGTELEFTGGINVGTASEFQRMLEAAGQVRVVHLNSNGGRVAEADLIAAEIEKRGLITYVSERCISACTHIFLAGRERWIGERGRLGFHQPTLAGLPKEEIQPVLDGVRRTLIAKGLPRDFVEKVMATPNDTMWEPSHAELRAAKIITGIADISRFAASGQFAKLASSDALEENLLKVPLYAALKRTEPQAFETIVAQVKLGYREGMPEAEIFASTRGILRELSTKRLLQSADAMVMESVDLRIAYLSALQNSDPESCVALEDDTRGATLRINLATRLPALAARELDLYEKIFGTSPARRSLPTEQQTMPTLNKVLEKLGKRSDLKSELLDKDRLAPAEFRPFCDLLLAFYQELRRLPDKQAADLSRYLLGQGAK